MAEEPICPEGSNVLVEIKDLGEVSDGGIIIPTEARDNYRQMNTIGYLVGMGPATTLAYHRGGESIEVKREMLPLKVSFPQYAGTPMRIRRGRETTNYRLVTEQDITSFLFDDEVELPREV